MSADRLKVHEADGGFQVLEEGEAIATFATILEAAGFVRDRGARLWLDWGRTVIAARSRPHDFSCSFLGSDSVGRILGEQHGPSAGTWFWSISTHDDRWRKHGGQRGREATKDQAVAELEREFTNYLASPQPQPSSYARAKGV